MPRETAPPPSPAYVDLNRDVVDRVVTRLAATGLLAPALTATSTPAAPSTPDPVTSCGEAAKVRDFLNMEIPNVRGGGPLDASFKLMRRSARDFVRAGGDGAGVYAEDPAYFAACLAAMRLTLGEQLDALRAGYGAGAHA